MNEHEQGADDPDIVLIADDDPARAGRAVRAGLDAGRRVAGYVGSTDDPAYEAFLADAIRDRPRPDPS